MAFSTIARRWPAAAPQLRAVLRPTTLRQLSRGYADETYTGKAFDDQEKAAENRYIRKMEQEANLAKKAAGAGAAETATTATPGTPPKAEATAAGGFRNTAIVAGLVAAVAGFWLLSGSSKKEEKEST